MGRRVTVKQAIKETGLTEYTLRQGMKQGRYPYIKLGVGAKKSKILIDITLLEEALEREALENTASYRPEVIEYGKLRRVGG